MTILVPAVAAGASSPTFNQSELFSWIGIAAFLVILANQLSQLWKGYFKSEPASAEVAKDLEHLTKTLNTGIDKLETTLVSRLTKLEDNTHDRFTAASIARKGIHQDIDLLRERTARNEAEIENIKQREALIKISGK